MAAPDAAIRPVTADDIPMLARIHVASWAETYPGILPKAEIAARTIEMRERQWAGAIAAGHSRIAVAPDQGFAQAGPQRDKALAELGFPQELYAIYLLRSGQRRGIGRALLRAVTQASLGPMTALVVAENAPAVRFYRATGARLIDTRMDRIGAAEIEEQAFGWDNPAAI